MTAVMRAMTSPTRTDTGLQQPELAQLAPHRLGHVLGAGRGTLEIGRRVLGFEIAPPLKRPPWPRLDRHDLGSEHQVTLADAALVDIGAHRNELLPASHLAADHPVERATVDQLVGALGNHAGAMQVLGLLAAGAPAFLADPVHQILDRVAAHAELDEMQCHCGVAGGPVRLVALRSIGGRAGCVLPPLAAAAGRRCGAGACLGAGAEGGVEPVVSGGNAGSAFMIVTGGIDAADGKNKPLRPTAAVGGCASPSPPPVATATGGLAPAGHAAAWRAT